MGRKTFNARYSVPSGTEPIYLTVFLPIRLLADP
jgi:hypothetical protein